ncbi:diguanylate cyclase [Marinobacter sp. CHS3-4]|uniref:sensor domain-containing diguanylate cyclase n=1 Tax=Marinobacter sp. CHS3-4 TaxID=3045174 RepID=UPI0024B54324|nr:diguanylate cyclase [Marinobacter sp. CHS3-4]MDI9246031.1 diguanylate cyclase [Marinobacter sp. CHS3-4]
MNRDSLLRSLNQQLLRLCQSFLVICLLFVLPALAQADGAVWKEGVERIEMAKEVEFWLEQSGPKSLEEVRQLPESAWQRNGSQSINLGYGDDVYWFRFQMTNGTPAFQSLYLEIAYPVLDHIELYMLQQGRLLEFHELGDSKPFDQRLIHHRNFLVPLTLTPGYPRTVYLRVDTTSSMQVPLVLWDRDAFFEAEQARSLFEGLYYGIVLVMILYNLFVYRAVGERSFLYYVGYIAAMPLFLASLHGVSYQYLWQDATWWNDRAIVVFLNLTLFFGVAFSLRFLTVHRSNHPILNRVMAALMLISGSFAAASVLVPYKYMILPTILLAALVCSILLLLGVVRWLKQDPAAKYYAVAWFFMLSGGIVLAFNKFTLLPRNFLTENATQVGSAIGVILLSVALADRLNQEKKRAFEAQQKLLAEERKARIAQAKSLQVQQEANTLLEQRVQERTQDLESLNERLQELSSTDALTGLKNRGYFDRIFKSMVVKAFRFGQPLSLLILDIDHFKKFNDTYGHLVGDDCLQMVAGCIGEYVTRTQDLAARYGGEEFVVLLPETPEEGAIRVAEKIRKKIEETGFRVSDEILHLTVSVGICAGCPERADATKSMFAKADEALYEAKGAGRNRVISRSDIQPVASDNPV